MTSFGILKGHTLYTLIDQIKHILRGGGGKQFMCFVRIFISLEISYNSLSLFLSLLKNPLKLVNNCQNITKLIKMRGTCICNSCCVRHSGSTVKHIRFHSNKQNINFSEKLNYQKILAYLFCTNSVIIYKTYTTHNVNLCSSIT